MFDLFFTDVVLWGLLALMSAAASYYILRPLMKKKLLYKPFGLLAFIAVVSFLPGLALILYLMLGSPGYSDLPLAKRLDVPPETLPLEGLVVPDEQPTPSVGDDPESSSGSTMVAALIILPLLGMVGWLLFQFRKPPQEPLQQAQSGGGLLARVENMNNS